MGGEEGGLSAGRFHYPHVGEVQVICVSDQIQDRLYDPASSEHLSVLHSHLQEVGSGRSLASTSKRL
ncbi:hypothetical protein GCM10022206_89040 [Streptomyces chiangmaiensis]